MTSGYDIAMSVDPNVSNNICSFCRHARSVSFENGVDCNLGFTGYFRSFSNLGVIFVSDCERGELRPEFAVADTVPKPAEAEREEEKA